MRAKACALIAIVLAVSGCSQPKTRASFDDGTPSERTLAAAETVRSRDMSKIPELITMLESGDPAQRMVASNALERLTGQSLGYSYSDPEPKRRQAIARWWDWYESGAEVNPAPAS